MRGDKVNTWQRYFDENFDSYYWYDAVTGESYWDSEMDSNMRSSQSNPLKETDLSDVLEGGQAGRSDGDLKLEYSSSEEEGERFAHGMSSPSKLTDESASSLIGTEYSQSMNSSETNGARYSSLSSKSIHQDFLHVYEGEVPSKQQYKYEYQYETSEEEEEDQTDADIRRNAIDPTLPTNWGQDYWGAPMNIPTSLQDLGMGGKAGYEDPNDNNWQGLGYTKATGGVDGSPKKPKRRRRVNIRDNQLLSTSEEEYSHGESALDMATISMELGYECSNWWVMALVVPIVGTGTMVFTVWAYCRQSKKRCLSFYGYPTLSYAAEFGAGRWIFESGMLATSIFCFITLSAFVWVCVENRRLFKERVREIRFCFLFSILSCGSLATLSCLNMRTHRGSHTTASFIYFLSSWICLFSVRLLRAALHRECKIQLAKHGSLLGCLAEARIWVLFGTGMTFLGFLFAVAFAILYYQINVKQIHHTSPSLEGLLEQSSILCQYLVLASLWPELTLLNQQTNGTYNKVWTGLKASEKISDEEFNITSPAHESFKSNTNNRKEKLLSQLTSLRGKILKFKKKKKKKHWHRKKKKHVDLDSEHLDHVL